MFKNTIEHIAEFYNINRHEELFDVLQKIIRFDSGYIFFITPEDIRIEYSYNSKIPSQNILIEKSLSKKLFKGVFDKDFSVLIEKFGIENYLAEPLKIKNTVFGILVISGDKFSEDEKLVFKSCAAIIANITKDKEINKILAMQIKALQEGILEINTENKKIKQSEEVKTNFLSHISHEIRTPLSSILCYSEMLAKELAGELNKKQKEFIQDIQTSGIHLLGIINEILDISKIEAGAMKLNRSNFELSTAVVEACNVIKPLAAQKEIDIATEVEAVTINADYQKIQQILFNLLSNAVKFTPNNGNIWIKVHKKENMAEIIVKDNGSGIATEDQERIFKKYEQCTDSNKSLSTGLGLTITKEFVKMHDGTITVHSKKGAGTEFCVCIPQI